MELIESDGKGTNHGLLTIDFKTNILFLASTESEPKLKFVWEFTIYQSELSNFGLA